MKTHNIHKTANKIIKKLKGIVTFDSVVAYLQGIGYTVVYYSTPEGKLLLKEYDLTELSAKVNALTYCSDEAQLVFVNDKKPLHDMLCSILHETAHITLGHLHSNPYAIDNRQNEMEAEALAYEILNHKKSYKPQFITATVLLVAIIATTVSLALPKRIEHTPYTPVSADILTEQTNELSQSVLVTPSGTKFHRSDCRYTKDKDCTTLTRSEALADYAPCSVCKP